MRNNRVVKYQRVSTDKQEVENQTSSLDEYIKNHELDCVGEYKETVSSVKSRNTRPELRRLLQDSKLRKFDTVLVYSIDRLGRSVVDVINTFNELREMNVNVVTIKQSIDTSTSQGELFLYFCSIFGQMEKDMISSRQSESIKRLRTTKSKWSNGVLHTDEEKSRVIELRMNGNTYKSISNEMNIPISSLQYMLKSVS
jgi:DNA invertase Pin-like site-specific DNA recombinase